uniref:Uncharacterized protein n=1 Tax=Arundo donax TaxID=35708 RepID=A0A0A9BBN0_ARUDO
MDLREKNKTFCRSAKSKN